MLQLSLGTPYVVNPSAMVDAMGHEQWREWQAFNQIYPVAHQTRMVGLIAQMLASFKTSDGMKATMPWDVQDQPESAKDRDAATTVALAAMPSGLRFAARPQSADEFIL